MTDNESHYLDCIDKNHPDKKCDGKLIDDKNSEKTVDCQHPVICNKCGVKGDIKYSY